MKGLRILILATCVCAMVSGCAHGSTQISTVPTTTATATLGEGTDAALLDGLEDALTKQGLRVRESTSTFDADLFGSQARFYGLEADDAYVRVYIVDPSFGAAVLASHIDADGYGYMTSTGSRVFVEWAGTPHFFRNERMIVFYLGRENRVVGGSMVQVSTSTDGKVMGALRQLLGPPFAGTNE